MKVNIIFVNEFDFIGFLIYLLLVMPLIAFVVLGLFNFFFSNIIVLRTVSLCFNFLILMDVVSIGFYYLEFASLSFNCFLGGLTFFSVFSDLVSNSVVSYDVGLDGISILFLFLTSFLIFICFIVSWNLKDVNFLYVLLFLLEFILLNIFCIVDLFVFYTLFEFVLIPMFIIIIYWGSRERKISAAYRFFFYTFFGSLFFLFSLLNLLRLYGSTSLFSLMLCEFSFSKEEHLLYWFSFFIAFAVKTPLFPFHTWLPEAHAEAPTVGSILLAGVLLKLGPYGLLRFSNVLFIEGFIYFKPMVYSLCLMGIYYTSFSALRQMDVKKIIAYSSIGHMSLVILGLMTNTVEGIMGALLLMFSHGFVSAGLFFLIGVLYDRYGTRMITYYGGLIQIDPFLGLLMFFFILGNIAFPGTMNFIAELLILISLNYTNSFVFFFSCCVSLLVLVYSIWFYVRIFFGSISSFIEVTNFKINLKEKFVAICLILPFVIGGIFPYYVYLLLQAPILNLIIYF